MDFLRGLLGFLQEYPLWLRIAAVAWLVIGAMVVGALVLIPRSPASSGRAAVSAEARQGSVGSHFEAALAGLLDLDCSRHRIAATPGVFTFERLICESLAELRQDLSHLAQLRRVLVGQSASTDMRPLHYDATVRFISSAFTEEEYGPKKNKLIALVNDLKSKALPAKGSREALARWNIGSDYTLDDLFIATGFLEWLVGHQARKIPPSEFYQLGPFYDQAFPTTERQHLVFRSFEHYAGPNTATAYLYIVSAFD